MKWHTGLNDFTTPDMYFHLFHSPADGNASHGITSNLGITISKHPNRLTTSSGS